jgi:hypothetical protein
MTASCALASRRTRSPALAGRQGPFLRGFYPATAGFFGQTKEEQVTVATATSSSKVKALYRAANKFGLSHCQKHQFYLYLHYHETLLFIS